MLTEDLMGELIRNLLPITAIIAVFTFITIAAWADARRKEREAHYRNDFRKKLVEQWGEANAVQVLELLKEEAANSERRGLLDLIRESDREIDPKKHRENMILAGLITTAAGVGMLIALQFVPLRGIWTGGLVPLFVGIAFLVHAYFVLGRSSADRSGKDGSSRV